MPNQYNLPRKKVRLDLGGLSNRFEVGDEVEFLAGDGIWKPGTIVRWKEFFPLMVERKEEFNHSCGNKLVRIQVGPKVCIIRHIRKVRYRDESQSCYGFEEFWTATTSDRSSTCTGS